MEKILKRRGKMKAKGAWKKDLRVRKTLSSGKEQVGNRREQSCAGPTGKILHKKQAHHM